MSEGQMSGLANGARAQGASPSGAQPGGGTSPGVQMRASVRGLDFEAQEAMLRPVQRKRTAAPVQREAPPAAEEHGDALASEADAVSSLYGESRGEILGILGMLPEGARAEVQEAIDLVDTYDDELWDTLDAARTAPDDAEAQAAFADACDRLDWGAELLDAYHALWSAFLAANVISLLQGLAALALGGIESLKARMAALDLELRALEKKIVAAKQDLVEVAAQTGLDIAVDLALPALLTALGVTNPLLGAALAVGGFLLTYQADNLLGVDTDGAHSALNNLNDGIDGLASGTEGVTKIVEGTGGLGEYGVKLAGGCDSVGKATAGLSLALDAWEGKIGYDRLQALRVETQTKLDKARELAGAWALVEPHIATIQRIASGLKRALPSAIASIGQEQDHIRTVRGKLESLGG